jgi:hypothetical protein
MKNGTFADFKTDIMTKSILLFVLGLSPLLLASQTDDQHNDVHNHLSDHRHEIGVSNAPVYFLKEQHFAYGLHGHYVFNIKHTRFGVGLGYERIFDEHKHNTMGVVVSYFLTDDWLVSISPGATFEGHINSGLTFSTHIETVYSWDVGDFHLGPAFEFAYDEEDYHISLGLHIAYGL